MDEELLELPDGWLLQLTGRFNWLVAPDGRTYEIPFAVGAYIRDLAARLATSEAQAV